jgi:hypothetical protein
MWLVIPARLYTQRTYVGSITAVNGYFSNVFGIDDHLYPFADHRCQYLQRFVPILRAKKSNQRTAPFLQITSHSPRENSTEQRHIPGWAAFGAPHEAVRLGAAVAQVLKWRATTQRRMWRTVVAGEGDVGNQMQIILANLKLASGLFWPVATRVVWPAAGRHRPAMQ